MVAANPIRLAAPTMETLPIEILSDILIRLPAKRLAQFRCVSKPMNALLTQPSFIKSHLHRSINKKDEMLLVICNGFCLEDGMPITSHPSHSPDIQNPNFINLPSTVSIPTGYTHSTVIGSLNGLICFVIWCNNSESGPDPIIYIWNPSLNAIRVLPPFAVPASPRFMGTQLHIRFAYDPDTDDYKVIKFTSEFRRDSVLDRYCQDWLEVEVYSMRKGSWSLINDRFPSNIDWTLNLVVRSMIGNDGRDGHLHWLCKLVGEGYKHAIVAFDLSTNTFSEISLPDSVGKQKNQMMVLADLAGRPCCMTYVENGDIEVWVMDDYGVAESWVKHHVISPFSRNMDPIGFTLTNELVLRGYHNQFALYDHIAGKFKPFKVYESDRHKVVPYVDSLVWIGPAS